MKFLKRRFSREDRKTDTSPTNTLYSGSRPVSQSIGDASSLTPDSSLSSSRVISPNSSPQNRNSQDSNSLDSIQLDTNDNNPFADIPLFEQRNPIEHQDLLIKKLKACCIVYDFKRNVNLDAKKSKSDTLLELIEYVNNTRNCFTEPVIQGIVEMVSANIFRSLTPTQAVCYNLSDLEEEEPVLDSAWPHLHKIYEIFLRLTLSNEVDVKLMKRYIDSELVLKLLDLFVSEDPRERDYLKTILHRVYGKIMALRVDIRKFIQHTFYAYIYENEQHKGIPELLEILGSIINGFALPLKEEHKLFLINSLIPLHKAKRFITFSPQLTYCMTQYVEKDGRLAENIIMGLIRYWPQTNTLKEVAFIGELEEVLDLTQTPEFQKVMVPLFQQLALCMQSPHFQVAERVLLFWNNEHIVKLLITDKEILFPIIITALIKNSKDHWNGNVHGITCDVSRILAETDSDLFHICSHQNLMVKENHEENKQKMEELWVHLEQQFLNRSPKKLL